jgi:hypothetical protein
MSRFDVDVDVDVNVDSDVNVRISPSDNTSRFFFSCSSTTFAATSAAPIRMRDAML